MYFVVSLPVVNLPNLPNYMSHTAIKLSAQTRQSNVEKANKVRSEGFIPAIMYGHGTEGKTLKVKSTDFTKVFAKAGETHLISLVIDEAEPIKVLVYETEKNPIKDNIIHIDFLQVNMKEKITVEIPLVYHGESKAVKELGGVLIKTTDHVEVECLPDNLVDHIIVHLDALETMADIITMNDLKLPEGMTLTSTTNETLLSIVEQSVEKEPEPVVAAVAEPTKAGAEKTEDKKEETKK